MQTELTGVLKWHDLERPGYFGRQRDAKVKALNQQYGEGNWRLVWQFGDRRAEFVEACRCFYESSYFLWLQQAPEEVDFLCQYGECIDNAASNVKSGCDYTVQEAYSTHIQDIVIRNCMRLLGRRFEGPPEKILVIRSKDSEGFRFGPGNVPFMMASRIVQPSKCPRWAQLGSVEDFWQSNKWIQIKK